MSGLLMAIAGALHPMSSGPKPPVQIILTSGSSWTVPADWNNADNTIELIGGGAKAYGGNYARKSNVALQSGANIAYQVGIGQRGAALATGDTWFKSTTFLMATCGAAARSSVGDVTYRGGASGQNADGGSGGGGAAGPNGNGVNGYNGTGGIGDAGFGGVGGANLSSNVGGAGSPGTEWGPAAGSGGGGGAGRFDGGSGGAYGGGGGVGNDPTNFTVGLGGPGVIVITYTPV